MSQEGGNLTRARSHIVFILGLLTAAAVVVAVEGRAAPDCAAGDEVRAVSLEARR